MKSEIIDVEKSKRNLSVHLNIEKPCNIGPLKVIAEKVISAGEGVSSTCNSINVNVLKKSMLQFSSHYYGKFNFSRKEVIKLQQNITNIITTSIAYELEKIIINDNISNSMIKSII